MTMPQGERSFDPCVKCGAPGSRVTDSRPYVNSPGWRRRRRKCDGCGELWTTLEIPFEFVREWGAALALIGDARDALDKLDNVMRGLGLPKEDEADG